MDIVKALKNPPREYRPLPFWSWNEKLTPEETRRQAKLMADAGLGGFFMHARGGLQTEYMSEEWFDNITAGIDEAEKHGMTAWAYDENGWPSGFGNGSVTSRGIAFQQKYLRMEQGEKHTERTITNCGGYHFYYDVNPFYIDTLDPQNVKAFLDDVYEQYYRRYGKRLPGFFTDEPQVSRDGIPWSFTLPAEYEKEYGEDLLPHLPELFQAVGDYETTRFRFWKLVTKLFTDSYAKQIYQWCDERGVKFTGHMVSEESLGSQITTNGAVMPSYEYFHIPGMDWLGRLAVCPTTPLQVASVAHQTGKKQVLTESFALTGWNVSFEELKWILEQQLARGVTTLCQHLEGYSIRGIRKRDYPPSIFYQQPWWEQYHYFNDTVSRLGMLMAEGRADFDTLLLHPQSSAWVCFDNGENEGLKAYEDAFMEAIRVLESKHIVFDLGDETMIEKHGRVENGKFYVGSQGYTTVVLPPMKTMFPTTKALLEQFRQEGGRVVTAEQAEPDAITDNENLLYTRRGLEGFTCHYFVNLTRETQTAKITKGNVKLDEMTGDLQPFSGSAVLEPMGSLVVFEGLAAEREEEAVSGKALPLDGLWEIKHRGLNTLTLDTCDYWIDGELIETNGHVSGVQERACAAGRPVSLRLEFHAQVDDVPQEVFLVCETPEIFTISVNGRKLEQKDCGYIADRAFRKLALSGMLRQGDNVIRMEVEFTQSQEVYDALARVREFEGEKNKLSYDMEIESIYLAGDFSVRTDGAFVELERDAVRYMDSFVIAAPVREVELSHIERQGFPFYAGTMTLLKTFTLEDAEYVLRFAEKHANIVGVAVNGEKAGEVIWHPYEADLSRLLRPGENTVELTLVGSLRNMLGPHHLELGESYRVCPPQFFKEASIWDAWGNEPWNDGYCFVHYGLE